MRFIWSTAVKDWWRHRRDPIGLIIWIGVPILIGGMITMVTGGSNGVQPMAHVLIADQDGTFVSGLLAGALGQMGDLVQTEDVTLEEGRRRIDDGDATALLIVPQGFGAAVLNEDSTTLELITNPSQRILPGIVEEGLSIVVDGSFYIHRVLGEEIKTLAAGPPSGMDAFSDAFIGTVSVNINQIVERLGDYLFPPLIEVKAPVEPGEEVEEEADGMTITVGMLFIPSILFMSLLFMAQGLSMDWWQERDQKTLRRVAVSPQSSVKFLAGKLVGGAGVMLLVTVIALGIGFGYFGLPVKSLPLAIVWSVISGTALSLIMTVIQLFVSSQRAGGVVSMAIIFPLMMVGGSFFPFEAMPPWMAAIGKMTPNGWALVQLKQILFDQVEPASLALAFAGLVFVSVVLFWISAWRLRAGFAQG